MLALAQPAPAQPLDSLRKASPNLAKLVPPVPTPQSFVSDAANVLSAASHADIDAEIRRVQSSGLGDIAVAIIPSIGDYAPVDVGLAIYRTWRVGRVAAIGNAQRNLGALILIVPKELSPKKKGECWISVGLGSQGAITDATAGTICRTEIIPELIKRNYSTAVMAGVHAIESRMRRAATAAGAAATPSPDSSTPTGSGVLQLATEPDLSTPSDDGDSNPFNVVAWVFGSIVAVGAGGFAGRRWMRHRKRTCPRCQKKMERLTETADDAALTPWQLVEEKIFSVDYDVWRCTCGERIILRYVRHFADFGECPKCHARAEKKTQKVLTQPTRHRSGKAENTFRCQACKAVRKELVTLPRISDSSSSSGGSSSSSSSGSSSGSSFGGSGSSDGAGGGSSY